MEEGSSSFSLKLLAHEEEKGFLDVPTHFKIVRRKTELYPEALKNIKRSLQFEFKNQFGHYGGQERSEHRIGWMKWRRGWKRGFKQNHSHFVLAENGFLLKESRALLHCTVKSLKALETLSENFGLGLVVLSSE